MINKLLMKSLLDNSKVLTLFATVFPGAFKLAAILLISLLLDEVIVKNFNQIYFYVLIISTLGLVPLASIVASKKFNFSRMDVFALIFIFSAASLLLMTFFIDIVFVNDIFKFNWFVIWASVLCIGGYEVSRRVALNNDGLLSIVVAGFSSCIFFVLFLCWSYLRNVAPETIVFFFSISLGLPLIIAAKASSTLTYFKCKTNVATFLSNYTQSFLSNLTSTLISTGLPFALIFLMKGAISHYLALIFTISSTFMMLPRFINERNIIKFRSDDFIKTTIEKSVRLGKWYFSVVSILAFFCFFISGIEDYFLYWLLFVGLQASQLCLPYSGLLMVNANFNTLLRINIIGSTPMLFFIPIYFFESDRLLLSYILISLYCFSTCLKFILSRKSVVKNLT